MKTRKPVIFCDFDGTITLTDNVIELFKHFRPEGAEEILERIAAKEYSIRQGVEALFALLPSTLRPQLTEFIQGQLQIRSGLRELLDFCKERDVEFLVTSGGMDFILYPALEPLGIPQSKIYCNNTDFSGAHIRVASSHPCDEHCHSDCGMCKSTVMRQYPQEEYYRIMIGDSITDFAGAAFADLIFARSHLEEECHRLQMPYLPFETFHDVIRQFPNAQL